MADLLLLTVALAAAVAGSELVLRRGKVQTKLGEVFLVFAGTGAAALATLLAVHGGGGASFLVFWSGAFLSWFGLRSHLESSILLGMLLLLREGPLTAEALIDRYQAHYGLSRREEELCRAGLAERVDGELRTTVKGRFVAGLARRLR